MSWVSLAITQQKLYTSHILDVNELKLRFRNHSIWLFSHDIECACTLYVNNVVHLYLHHTTHVTCMRGGRRRFSAWIPHQIKILFPESWYSFFSHDCDRYIRCEIPMWDNGISHHMTIFDATTWKMLSHNVKTLQKLPFPAVV